MNIVGVILAADRGEHMNSKTHKSLHLLGGKPIIDHVANALRGAAATGSTLVIEDEGEELCQHLCNEVAASSVQAISSTSANAKLQMRKWLEDSQDATVLLLRGDIPLLTESTLHELLRIHQEGSAGVTALSAKPEGGQSTVKEAYTGVCLVDSEKLLQALDQMAEHDFSAQSLLELAAVWHDMEEVGDRCYIADAEELMVINNRLDLAEAEKQLRERIIKDHMLNGVTFLDPSTTYIECEVTIARDTTILPGCSLKGATQIGEDCQIGPYSEITDSRVGNGIEIKQSILVQAEVGDGSHVGPYAYLRPGSKLGSEVKVGDFVEIKNATLGNKTKVSHLSYVGDAIVGEDVNIGCGAITVNYDGFRKHRTEIGDHAFVGSNVNLVAPVKIGKGAFVVAGSTITSSIEDGDMAIARERQVTKTGYADRLKARLKAQADQNK